MTILQALSLGALQGLAEFLPISSSGHLAVVQNLFGLTDVPLLFDVLLHLATLLAVCIYFWKKIWALLKCLGRWIARKPMPENQISDDLLCGTDERGRKAIIAIILSTLVTGVMGIVTSKLIPEMPIKVTCAGFVFTALLLIVSAIIGKKRAEKANASDNEKGITWIQALVIGFMQGIGTLPGVSRSGSTISGAMFSGLDRKIAGDYSFIISIPAILGAFILEVKDLDEVSGSIGLAPIMVGCTAAFIVGYLSLALLMKMIRKGKLQWFAAYLIPLGILGMIFLH